MSFISTSGMCKLTWFDLWCSPSCITVPRYSQHMICECLSKDEFRMMRFLLGRTLNVDLDSGVLHNELLTSLTYDGKTTYVDIWQLGNFTSHQIPRGLPIRSRLQSRGQPTHSRRSVTHQRPQRADSSCHGVYVQCIVGIQ
jgi:hypothetical protein